METEENSPAPQIIELVVILPIFNEAKSIEGILQELLSFARKHRSFEFRIVDDGSSDGTPDKIANELSKHQLPNVSLIRHLQNAGKGTAIFTGFQAGPGDLFCFTDGDLAYSPDHLLALQQGLATHAIVIGSRELVPHIDRNSARRKLLGWGFNCLVRILLGLPYRDTQAGLKAFHREAVEKIFNHLTLGGFAFDVEFLYLAKKFGFSILEIPATVSESHSYKKGNVKLLKDSFRMFVEIIAVRLKDMAGSYNRP